MALPNAFNQYTNSKIMTATGPELTLMLYDGAIRFCNAALIGIEENNIEKASNNLIKAQRIIDYLQQTLDMKYPVAKDFDNIYSYLGPRLILANVKKDPEIIEEILTHLRSVRDTWKEVMRTAGNRGGGLNG